MLMSARLVNSGFRTPPAWRSGHLQTIRSRIVRTPFDLSADGTCRTLLVQMNDGSGDRLHVYLHESRRVPTGGATGGLVLLIHGLGGSSESSYIRAMTAGLLRAGYNVARLDLRGVGESAATCSLLYHGGRSADLRTVINALSDEPEAADNRARVVRIAIMGFSLGGNVTLKLLGESTDAMPLFAGIAVSAPLDLVAGSVYLRRAGLGVYEKALVRSLKAQASLPHPDGRQRLSKAEREGVASARTLAEFDDVLTAPRNGWRDSAEYYSVNSSNQFLPTIDVPTLVIHSLDDPMIPALPYRVVDWEGLECQGIHRKITQRGGHVGFHEAAKTMPWFVDQSLEFLARY